MDAPAKTKTKSNAKAKPAPAPVWNTTFKVRLYPTPAQAELFDKTFGCCRYLWNQILADQERFYDETGEHFLPTPARYKKQAPFLREVDSVALSTVHQDLKKAFQHFFEQPETYRHPVFKKRKRERASYTTYCQYYANGSGASIYLTDSAVRLPKAGLVRANLYRKPHHSWTLKAATISRSPTGKYFCSLLFACPGKAKAPEPEVLPERLLTVYRTSGHFYGDSQGNAVDLPDWIFKTQAKLSQAQRRLARMQSGSQNHKQQLQKVRKLFERLTHQRNDFLHQESRRIANAWDGVQIQTASNADGEKDGFGRFQIYLTYKCQRLGKPCLTA